MATTGAKTTTNDPPNKKKPIPIFFGSAVFKTITF